MKEKHHDAIRGITSPVLAAVLYSSRVLEMKGERRKDGSET
jgi:hypothetical protein